MKKRLLYLLFVGIATNGCAQTQQLDNPISDSTRQDSLFRFEEIRFLPGTYSTFDVDVLDNLYLLTPGKQLKKYNAKGDSVSVYNDVKNYGIPTSLDVTNPFKILIYYKNFSTLVVLDRQLSYRNSINLRKLGMFRVNAIATSYDNHIWLFDDQTFQLLKMNDEGERLMESTDLRMLYEEAPSPTKIIDHNNFVYLYDSTKGFYIFDYFGAPKNHLPFTGWSNIAVSADYLYGFSEQNLHTYKLQSLQLAHTPIPESLQQAKYWKALNGKLYVLKAEGLYIYQIQ